MMEGPDWPKLVGHADNRSGGHPGDTDIPVLWAAEARRDDNAAVIDPDYNSRSGQSLRLIGWSASAGFLVTVIVVRYEGRLFAASAWRSNQKDQRLYYEGGIS
ncbi:MAG: hypothetical protein LBI33_14415 [Propionibacteriaceae bacterium]|nr:hypothetical protein [Propionibacteriaceae bacterium]